MKTINLKLVRKVIIYLSLSLTFSGFCQVGIGTSEPSNQSSLDITATDKGFLIPRLTTAQRTTLGTSLTTAANNNNKGMQVFDTDLNLNLFWNGSAWRKNNAIAEWVQSGVYETGDVVKKENVLYEANGDIALNTAFLEGTAGATWKRINNAGSVPNWIFAGTIQSIGPGIQGTTAGPTLPTTMLKNAVYYRQVGAKTWEVMLVHEFNSNSGASNGTGDYVFTLPNNLQFNTSLPFQNAFTGDIGLDTHNIAGNALPNSFTVYGISGYSSGMIGGVIPWDATRYRVIMPNGNTSRCWGQGRFGFTEQSYQFVKVNFTFQSL